MQPAPRIEVVVNQYHAWSARMAKRANSCALLLDWSVQSINHYSTG